MDEPIPRPNGPLRLGPGDTVREESEGADSMRLPPKAQSTTTDDDNIETRSTRSASTASRTANRLSLTLPIAPPTAFPSRPTPSSSVMGSCPPTPIETSGLVSPVDPADFITAVAAQERRVLELREELSRAEKDLGRLKKQWAQAETHKKRIEARHRPLAPASETPTAVDNDTSTRHNVEIDKRKALLLGQQSAQGTPTQSRRRVFQGGHTRTLSLLSPTKSDSDAFSVHEDETISTKSPSKELDAHFHQAFSKYAPANAAQLAKRASWAPRSVQQVGGLKQAADDFRTGLWTFVEDLRQATVGDEPITGGDNRGRGHARIESVAGEDQATIRASGVTARPGVSQAFDETPTPTSRFADPLGIGSNAGNGHRRNPSKLADRKAKHFSWTPLTVDSYDDNDWSNWDSPTILGLATTGKSPRWSGSTVGGGDVGTADENARPSGTPLKQEVSAESSGSAPVMSPTKLAELNWPTALSPSNLKRTATDLMREFEKSLSPSTEVSVGGQRTQPSS